MKRIKCISVRLEALVSVSDRAYKAYDFNGNSDIIPKSQVFGRDWDVQKSDAYWIAEWILRQKSITSGKKEAWFNSETGEMLPTITVTHHTPERIEVTETKTIKRLKK